MAFNYRKHRLAFLLAALIFTVGTLAPLFLSASCRARQQGPEELKARETLRTMTRGGVLPAEDAVARIESRFPNTTAGALARMVHARIKLNAKDFKAAAKLLDAKVIHDYTPLEDYALLMRGDALERAGRRGEARTAYEQLAREYPAARRARDATLRDAELLINDNQPAAAAEALKELAAKDDAAALLLTAKAYEQSSSPAQPLAAYRRIYFFAPTSGENEEAATAIRRLGSTNAPANAEEAVARAERLFQAKHYSAAFDAYTEGLARFPNAFTPELQLHRGIAAANAKKLSDAAAALSAVPISTAELRAEALYHLALAYARARQWAPARSTTDELHRAFPNSAWTPRAFVGAGQIADEAKNAADAAYFYRAAVNFYPGAAEVTPAQFYLAWQAHEAKRFAESSNLLTEHLASYTGKNTDFRGRAGYWAARDSERAGKLAEARAIYQALQARYSANWYGYLAKKRVDALERSGNVSEQAFAPDSQVGRALANLQTVTVAEETAGAREDALIAKAEQLSIIGDDSWALEELAVASQTAPDSQRLNLATARILRWNGDNVAAFNTLKRSYPDYSQMHPEELRREEWEVFYPLAYWDIIVQESRARGLDPFQVAGLIRQESVFDPRARSSAKAYGLMQLLVPTASVTARKYGIDRAITPDSLYEPRLNIQLGTAYLRDQLDKYGRIEYVAAAYNAGSHRVEQWRASLPSEIDEWSEEIPLKETRGYVQGVVRNTLQYRRLYDEKGQFRVNVGARAIYPQGGATPPGTPAGQPANPTVRVRRLTGGEEEE